MQLASYTIVLLTTALFLAASFRLFQLIQSRKSAALGDGEFDIARYRPMERLLRADDEQFLSTHGFGRSQIRRFRAERRRTFRCYLRQLDADFAKIIGLLRSAMVESSESRTDLARALFRAQLVFTYAVLAVEFRLAMHALGAYSVTIDVKPLIASLEQMREQCASFDLSAAAA